MIANALLRALRAIEQRRRRVVIVMPRHQGERLYARLSQPSMATSKLIADEHRALVATVEDALNAWKDRA